MKRKLITWIVAAAVIGLTIYYWKNDPALDSDAYRRAVGAAVPIPAGMSAYAADRCRIYHLHIIH